MPQDFKDTVCQYSLFCLAEGAEISAHTSTRNATIQVIAGHGTLTLNGEPLALAPGMLIMVVAHTPHALAASSNLAFLLTLSAEV
jgi:quercetin dioxygenase-like cupin family protein